MFFSLVLASTKAPHYHFPRPPTRLGRRRSSMQGNVRASVRETREQKNQRRASKALTLRRDSRSVVGVGEGGNGLSSGQFLGNCGWMFCWPIQLLQSNWVYHLFFQKRWIARYQSLSRLSMVQIFFGISAPSRAQFSLPYIMWLLLPTKIFLFPHPSHDIRKTDSRRYRIQQEKTKDMPKKVAPPERLTLAKLSGKHNIPMQVGTWMFLKNAAKQFQGAKATEVVAKGSELYQNYIVWFIMIM